VSADRIAALNSQLRVARAGLEALRVKRDAYVTAAENRHWTELDSATLSGIRRKPNPKADAARFASYARQADVFTRFDEEEKRVALLEAQIATARTERERKPFTRTELASAVAVKDKYGWHKVRKVNAVSVSVESGYSWTEKIAIDKVLDYRDEVPA